MGGAAALILSFVLAELYCAFVVKSRLRLSSTAAATSPIRIGEVPTAARLNSLPKAFSNSLYSQGVLGNHRFLFTIKEETLAEETLESPNSSSGFPPNLHFIGLINPRNQIPILAAISAADPALESGRSSLGDSEGEFICISNPIYEIGIEIDPADQATLPFETPVSSPSKLEDADGDASPVISVLTPPLSPMNLRGSAPPVSLLGNMLSPSWSESSSSVYADKKTSIICLIFLSGAGKYFGFFLFNIYSFRHDSATVVIDSLLGCRWNPDLRLWLYEHGRMRINNAATLFAKSLSSTDPILTEELGAADLLPSIQFLDEAPEFLWRLHRNDPGCVVGEHRHVRFCVICLPEMVLDTHLDPWKLRRVGDGCRRGIPAEFREVVKGDGVRDAPDLYLLDAIKLGPNFRL